MNTGMPERTLEVGLKSRANLLFERITPHLPNVTPNLELHMPERHSSRFPPNSLQNFPDSMRLYATISAKSRQPPTRPTEQPHVRIVCDRLVT